MLSARGKSPHKSCQKKKTSHATLCLKFAVLPDIRDLTAASRIAPEGDSSPFFKILILWVSTKLEVSPLTAIRAPRDAHANKDQPVLQECPGYDIKLHPLRALRLGERMVLPLTLIAPRSTLARSGATC